MQTCVMYTLCTVASLCPFCLHLNTFINRAWLETLATVYIVAFSKCNLSVLFVCFLLSNGCDFKFSDENILK